MRYFWLVTLLLVTIQLSALHILTEDASVYTLNENTIKEFDIVERVTIRTRNGEDRKDIWSGIRFTDIQKKWRLTESQVIQFLAHDRYLIMLNQSQIAEFDPIIAVARNSRPLDNTQFRLVSDDMPEMFWVANLRRITPIKEIVIPEPVTIYTYHTILPQVRLHENPEPFTGVKGYRLWDIVSIFSRTSSVTIRLVSKDGLEQIIDFQEYLRDAVLVVEGDVFSIQSPSMPSGMWLKDIMLIEVNAMAVFFYRNIDRENNEKYREFIERASRRDRTAYSLAGRMEITDWEELRWESITFVR